MTDLSSLLNAPLPVAFQFTVNFNGMPPGTDSSFQEVSGLEQVMETEELREGGENRFVHQLPKGVQQKKLTLKRCVADVTSPLIIWCKATLEGGLSIPIFPVSLLISLRNASMIPVRVWMFRNAFPVRWDVDTFNSTKNEVAVETIELAYQYMQRIV